MCNWMLFQEHEIRDMEKHIPLALVMVYKLNFCCNGKRLNIYISFIYIYIWQKKEILASNLNA